MLLKFNFDYKMVYRKTYDLC